MKFCGVRDRNFVFTVTLHFLVIYKIECQQISDLIEQSPKQRLLVLSTVGWTTNDDFARFNRSIDAFNLDIELIPLDNNHPIERRANDKFERLREAVARHKQDNDAIILLVESGNSILNGDRSAILKRFDKLTRESGAKIVFSSDTNCWPSELAQRYDKLLPVDGARYLNSRALIGNGPSMHNLFEAIEMQANKSSDVEGAKFDFQTSATNLYLNELERQKLGIVLDHKSELFQSLNARRAHAEDEVELAFDKPDIVRLKNLAHSTWPVVIHSGGLGRIALNSLGNYLGKAWTPSAGCRHCNASKISLKGIRDADMPRLLLAIFIDEPTPFMETFYETIRQLDYPRKQIHLFIHNSVAFHSAGVDEFVNNDAHEYASLEIRGISTASSAQKLFSHTWQARHYSLELCKKLSCDYYLSLDSLARLDRHESLRDLIETNRTIVAPALSRPHKLWSNYWAAISDDGFYWRSHDYVDLVARKRLGVWNVPLVMHCYLIEGKFLRRMLDSESRSTVGDNQQIERAGAENKHKVQQHLPKFDYYDERYPHARMELIFARNMRDAGIWLHVNNEYEFGHLIDPSGYNLSRTWPDFYELEKNPFDWQQVYMHEKYFDLFDERDENEGHPDRIRLESPCQDVYRFPLVSQRFCTHLIEIMETFGQWSSGKNDDPRIEGGYESVPTRDIHFRQVGLHQMWLYFLRQFVMPIQMKEYIGYEHDPPRTDLAFVVRYNPSEQASLRPHHDSSTYTINIALNLAGSDYEGGGCRFVRYNCSVTDSRPGWALIHPGRLTHYHEGLPVTNGTRYISVTFVDP